jgi:hypothetical protein
MHQNILRLAGRDSPYTTIVEPWADEFAIMPGTACRIVVQHPQFAPSFEVEVYDGALVVTVLEGGSTYEFWRGSALAHSCTIPIPW